MIIDFLLDKLLLAFVYPAVVFWSNITLEIWVMSLKIKETTNNSVISSSLAPKGSLLTQINIELYAYFSEIWWNISFLSENMLRLWEQLLLRTNVQQFKKIIDFGNKLRAHWSAIVEKAGAIINNQLRKTERRFLLVTLTLYVTHYRLICALF